MMAALKNGTDVTQYPRCRAGRGGQWVTRHSHDGFVALWSCSVTRVLTGDLNVCVCKKELLAVNERHCEL